MAALSARRSESDSFMNVLNVVNPPQKPTVRRSFSAGLILMLFSASP